MALFSERIGVTPVKSIIQIESTSQELKNRLWSILYLSYFKSADYYTNQCHENLSRLFSRLWIHYFKKPYDDLPYETHTFLAIVKVEFLSTTWYEPYNFIEFVLANFENDHVNTQFGDFANSILESEISGYRLFGKKFAQITSEEEISSIKESLEFDDIFKPVSIHIKASLDKLSDRTNPDYRNSIKESISAVESYCKLVTGNPKATLGNTLDMIDNSVKIHPALKNSLKMLYGYTSDSDGIRHALLEEEKLNQDDAKFMLVSCSAFINYLKSKYKIAK